MSSKPIVEVIEFTDPVCTWCWGSEPVLRKLETVYGDQLKVSYVMGGLVKDIRQFYDSYHGIGGDASKSNVNIAKHWVEASQRHGMPIKSEGFNLFSNDLPSTYPQNIAFKAAQMENEELAIKFLRRIREATATEARITSKLEVQIELASEVGLDVAAFIQRMNDGSAKKAFEDDLKMCAEYKARGFPTFLVKSGEKGVILPSYQRFEVFDQVIKMLAGDSVKSEKPANDEAAVKSFVEKYRRVAPAEIEMALDISKVNLKTILDKLEEQKSLRRIPVGNGSMIEAASNPMECADGLCAL